MKTFSTKFLLFAGIITLPALLASAEENDDYATMLLTIDFAEDGDVSQEEKSEAEESVELALQEYEETLLLNSKHSPNGIGSISASASLNSQIASRNQSIAKHGRKGSGLALSQSAAVSPAGLVGVPAASGVALVGSISILESVPETDEVPAETLATGTVDVSLLTEAVSRTSLPVTFFALSTVSSTSTGTPIALGLTGTEGTTVDPATTLSGSTSLANLSALITKLKGSHSYVNVAGYPFVPFADAGYTLQSSDGKTIDTFWQTKIDRGDGKGFVTVDSTANFYAYTANGWYDVTDGKQAPLDWLDYPSGVAMFGKTGSSTNLTNLTLTGETSVLAGIVVGDGNEKSGYVNLTPSSSGGILILEKTSEDEAYNELAVNIFAYGELKISGFDAIVINSNVLVNKDASSTNRTITLDSPLVGGTSIDINGNEHKNAIYFERTIVKLNASNENYTGDWYFGFQSTVTFGFAKEANNPFGTGTLNFRATNVTFAGNSEELKTGGDIYVTVSNDMKIDGASSSIDGFTGNTRSLTINEVSRSNTFNEDTRAYNRIYRVISGNLSDGSRGVGKFIWANRSSNSMNYKNETWIFTGDNSGYGSTAWYQDYRNNKTYATWDLGTSTYNTANIGIAMPMVFGDGSDFAYKNADGSMKYDAIAGLGGFTAASGTTSALSPDGQQINVQGHTGIGFNYSNSVQVNNAIFGTIRVYHLGTGTLELTNTSNTFDAGVWVTNGGTLSFSDAKTLGAGTVNILTGTLEYTGTGDATLAGGIDNKSAIARTATENSQTTGAMNVYEQKHFGDWAVNVTNAGATLLWDATKTDSYSANAGVETGVRSGDFTKLGDGTLKITAGTLVNSSTWAYDSNGLGTKNDTAQYTPDVSVKEGTLALAGTASLGGFSTVYMDGGKLSSEADITLGETQRIYSGIEVAIGPENGHEIEIGTTTDGNFTAGTLTLNGGALAYEFTNLIALEGTNINAAQTPSWNWIKLEGNLAVDETNKGSIEIVLTKGAVFTKGYYKLLETSSEISAETLGKLSLAGFSSEGSRQTISILSGDKISTNDITITDVTGTANELYLYVDKSTAILHWNGDGDGIWKQHADGDSAENKNWKPTDSALTDTNFYANDVVVFCDLDDLSGGKEITQTPQTITISGEVKPMQIVSNANSLEYIIKSDENGNGHICGTGRIEKSGTGTLTIYTENDFTGGADISAGTVNALAKNALGTGLIRVYAAGNLNVGAIAKDNFGDNKAAIDNVLSGSIQLESAGTINIFGSNILGAGSTVTVSGGELHANATGSLQNATINVTGGKIFASGNEAFDSTNSITLEGTSTDAIAILQVDAENGIGNANVTVKEYAELHAHADGIGTGTVTLYGGNNGEERAGALVIESNSALHTLKEIVFRGGVIVMYSTDTATTYDISQFDKYTFDSDGSAFYIGENAQLNVNGKSLLSELTSTMYKSGAGTLHLDIDAGDSNSLRGSASFLESEHHDEDVGSGTGTIVLNFKNTTENTSDISYFRGEIYEAGTLRTEGGKGYIGAVAGKEALNFEYAAKQTIAHTKFGIFSETDLATWKSTSKFIDNEVAIYASNEDARFYTGTIVNGTSEAEITAEKNATIHSIGADATIVVTQNTADGTLYANVKNYTGTLSFIDDNGTTHELNGTFKTSLEVHSAGNHVLTLGANNNSTGALDILEGATVKIGTGLGTDGNWAGDIAILGTLEICNNGINISDGCEVLIGSTGTLKALVTDANVGITADNGVINFAETAKTDGTAGKITFFSDGENSAKLVLDLSNVSTEKLLNNKNENGVVAVKIVASSAIENYADFSSINWDGENFSADGNAIISFDGLSLVNESSVILASAYDTATGTLLLAIPEPSLFGVLAGLGALALAASRRRRK